MKILVDGKVIDGVVRDGRVEVTFTKQTKDPIQISPIENCNGTTVIDNIQLEQADKATAYEDPALIQGEATGLIKDIRGLEYAINDPVNGLRSQLTILAQGFEAEVADAIGNYSVQGQTIDGLFSEIKSIDGNLNQLIRNAEGNNQLISSIQNDVAQNRLDYHSLKETADSYERIIGSSQAEFENNVSRAVQTSGLIQQEVASLTSGLSTTVSQLENSWIMELKNENDIKTALNATTDGLRLKGDLIHLTGTTAVDGDFWAKEVNAIKINADNIVSGQIDASKIRVVNLDVNSLAGNRATLISAGLISSSGGSLELNGDQILSTASDGSQTYIQKGLVGTRAPSSAGGGTIGQIGYAYETSSPWYSMQISNGSHFQIRMSRGAGELNKQAFYIISGGTESYLNTDNIYLNPSSAGRVRVQGAMTIDGVLRSEGTVLVRSKLEYLNGGFIESQEASSNMLIASTNKLIMYSNGTQALEIDGTHAVFRRQISENSDVRLKTNIVDMPINSLEAIMGLEIKKFDYLDGRTNQYGIIAQQAQHYLPELIDVDSQGYLMVNKSALPYINMHATQLINRKLDNHIEHTTNEIVGLKQEIKQLKEEIAYLKGA